MIAVYKAGGKTKIWGDLYDVKHVESKDLASYISNGWRESPQEAKNIAVATPESQNESGGGNVIKTRGRPRKGG